jgi:small-conductance mechanosensitive channel
MANSGLDFQLLVWIDDPSRKGLVIDRLNKIVYKAFYEHGIEIPFPQRDIHIRSLPDDGALRIDSGPS